jgi:hypothetical protein
LSDRLSKYRELSSRTVDALRAYERLGSRLCGGLYDGTPAEGEVALFLSCSLVDHGVRLGGAGP